jgi:hypothetical protein
MNEYFYPKKKVINSAYIFDQLLMDENEKIILACFYMKNKEKKFFPFTTLNLFSKNSIFIFVNREKIFDFDLMYELHFDSENMLFYKNKKILIDSGTGNNNKIKNLNFEKKKNIRLFLEKMYTGLKKGKNNFFLS